MTELLDSVGERLRRARLGQQLSLKQVADQADISPATLSRIETRKQAVGLAMFLHLASILGKEPTDLLDDPNETGNGGDRVVARFSDMSHADRIRFWSSLSSAARLRHKAGKRRAEVRQLAMQVEELLACIDFVQAELQAIQKKLKK